MTDEQKLEEAKQIIKDFVSAAHLPANKSLMQVLKRAIKFLAEIDPEPPPPLKAA